MKENLAKTTNHSQDLNGKVPNGASSAGAPSIELARTIVKACEEAKGEDIVVLNVAERIGIADYFVIVSARSDRQAQGISNRVIDALSKNGLEPLSMEGFEKGQWVLLDCEDVVLHVFYESARDYYDIENLWHDAPRVSLTKSKRTSQDAASSAR